VGETSTVRGKTCSWLAKRPRDKLSWWQNVQGAKPPRAKHP